MLGTTMATNAIVEGELPPVALLTTVGYRDTLEIGRQNRRELYRLDVATASCRSWFRATGVSRSTNASGPTDRS